MKKRRRERNGWWVIKEFFHYVNISGRAAFSCCCCLLSAPWYIYTCVCVQTPQRRKPPSLLKKKGKKRAVQEFIITWWRVSKRQERSARDWRGRGAAMKSRLGLAVWHAHHQMRTSRKSHRLFRISPPFFSNLGKTVGQSKNIFPPFRFCARE